MTRELFQAPHTGTPQHWDDFHYCQAKCACQWVLWEVLMLVDSEVAARVSGAAETVDYFG